MFGAVIGERLGVEYISTIVEYSFQVYDQAAEERQALITLLDEALGSEVGGKMATFAQRLRDEGREQGILQGMQQGMQMGLEDGVYTGKQEAARNMLREGLDPQLIVRVTGLDLDKIEKLQREHS
jgi:predicted transposase YdaD